MKPLLKAVKAALVGGDELGLSGDRDYIKATARFIDCESGETVENTAYAREEQEKKVCTFHRLLAVRAAMPGNMH